MIAESLTPTSNPLLDAALAYAERGWLVMPLHSMREGRCSCGEATCKSAGKHPRLNGWRDVATLIKMRDPQYIRHWWQMYPDANVGVLTGPESGLCVIDIDPRNGGVASWAKWEREHGTPVEDTTISHTGSGGRHIIYRHPGGYIKSRSGAFGDDYPGIDVKADGGYIVAPPSVSGAGLYEWDDTYGIDECEPAELPPRLQFEFREAEKAHSAGLKVLPDVVGRGAQHDTLVSLVGTLRRRGLGATAIFAALQAEAQEKFDPVPSDADLDKIIRSTARWEPEPEPPLLRVNSASNSFLPLRDKGEEKRIEEGAGIDPRWVPKPISQLRSLTEEIPWQWYGYVAAGNTTLFTGLWKSGKSTLLSYLLKAAEGATQFAGFAVAPAKILVVTEEIERHWITRRDKLLIGDHVHIISRPFLKRADVRTWEAFLVYVTAQVKEHGYTMVVIDSLHNLWPVRDENNASDTNTAMMPLQMITELNASVLLIGHPSKSDAGEGRATRGSGAVAAFADIIVEMRRYDAEHRDDTRRVLASYSRYEETPAEAVLHFTPGEGYELVGTKAEVKAASRHDALLELLPTNPPGENVREILAAWPDDLPKISEKQLNSDLYKMFALGDLDRFGEGVRNKPYTYWRK